MKYIKLYEQFEQEDEIKDFLNNYFTATEYHEDKDLEQSVHTQLIDYDGEQDIIVRDSNKGFVFYNIVDKPKETQEEPQVQEYDKFQPLNPWEKVYDFHKDPQFDKFFYGEDYTDKDLKELGKILRNNKGEDYVLMYHGTSSAFDIENDGLKKTKVSTKRSIQSKPGFVYLSAYPDMAKRFGEMAYPTEDICVYQVFIKIKYLKPDKDQLRNKRVYSDIDVKDTLVNSLVYGHGARVPRNIEPYELKLINKS